MNLQTATNYDVHRAAVTAMCAEAQQIVTIRLRQGATVGEALRSARRPLRAAARARVLADITLLQNATWTG